MATNNNQSVQQQIGSTDDERTAKDRFLADLNRQATQQANEQVLQEPKYSNVNRSIPVLRRRMDARRSGVKKMKYTVLLEDNIHPPSTYQKLRQTNEALKKQQEDLRAKLQASEQEKELLKEALGAAVQEKDEAISQWTSNCGKLVQLRHELAVENVQKSRRITELEEANERLSTPIASAQVLNDYIITATATGDSTVVVEDEELQQSPTSIAENIFRSPQQKLVNPSQFETPTTRLRKLRLTVYTPEASSVDRSLTGAPANMASFNLGASNLVDDDNSVNDERRVD